MNFFHSFIRLVGIWILASAILLALGCFTSFSLNGFHSMYISTTAFLVSLLVIYIFIRGSRKGGKAFLINTLLAISLKFFLYLVMILIYYFLAKKLTLEFVLTFFVIYLGFTSYIIFSFIKQLKTIKQDNSIK